MKLLYVANMRMPTEKAHGAQIMKACEALALQGVELSLLVPTRTSPITNDPFVYYGLKTRFSIKKLFCFDTVRWGKIGFILQSISFGVSVAKQVRKNKEAVVYGRDEIVLATLICLTGRKVFWESHDGAWNLWAKFVAKRAQGIVVVTKGAVSFYSEKGIVSDKILPLPNGIDLQEFSDPASSEDARMRLGLPREKKIALYVGKLGGWKGVETLLEASHFLSSNILTVIIGGEDAQVQELREKYPKVIFLGSRPYRELRDNQAAADVLILPNTGKDQTSVLFTSPLKLFSYMASKRPIVASDLPSIREIVSDESAFFFEADNARSLAESIEKVFSNQEQANRVAYKAYEEVLRYTWEARAKKLLSFIA